MNEWKLPKSICFACEWAELGNQIVRRKEFDLSLPVGEYMEESM